MRRGRSAGLLLAATAITPATAGQLTPNKNRYAALGDSYAAGVGNTPLRGSGDSGRSSEAYPVLLAGSSNRVTFLAESGATTVEVMMEQVPMVPASANQITLTVGGNDVGFMTVAQACAEAPSTCQDAILAAADKLGDMGADLGLLITALKAKAPKATIFVTGYPQIFQPSLTDGCPALPLIPLDALYAADSAIESPNPAIQPGLNDVIQGVALGAGAVYVDVDVPAGICTDPDGFIFATTMDGGVPLHPTAAGLEAYADAIEGADFVTG